MRYVTADEAFLGPVERHRPYQEYSEKKQIRKWAELE
tara:strand:+ start:55 stop:165 length:111 start_codon:yes stop_codon:yes gene_type:complete